MQTKRELRWLEPWFFALRRRDRRGWQRRGWFIAAIFGAMMGAWWLDLHYGKGPRFTPLHAVSLNLFVAIFLGFLPDLGRTSITVSDEGIGRVFIGHGIGASFWPYRELVKFSLVPRRGPGQSGSMLLLFTTNRLEALAVPPSVPSVELLEMLRSKGVTEIRPEIVATFRPSD
jgi:hypothetical protein